MSVDHHIRLDVHLPIVGSCTTINTYVFLVNSSSTAVNSSNSISSEWNSSRTREHACLNALTSSDVRSYRVGASLCGSESRSGAIAEPWENVVGVRRPLECDDEGVEIAGDMVGGGTEGEAGGGEEVAMTRKVVRSKRITSVALHA